MAEETSKHHHHHSHDSRPGSKSSKKSHNSTKKSKSSKSSISSTSKSRRDVNICIALNGLLIFVAIALGIMSKGCSLFGVGIFAMFNLPLLFLAYFSLKLRKIPSYEYKADVYKHRSVSMLTIALPIALILSGILLIMGCNRIDDDTMTVGALPLILGGLCGAIVNGLSHFLLNKAKSKTTACRVVHVNFMIGAFISTASFIAGILLLVNEKFINSDPYVTILISIGIIVTAIWVLHTFIKKGFHMLPKDVEIEQVISVIKLNETVKNYKHLNIWTNNAEEVELSVHLSLDDMDKVKVVKDEIKEGLRNMGIDIVTLAFKKHKED